MVALTAVSMDESRVEMRVGLTVASTAANLVQRLEKAKDRMLEMPMVKMLEMPMVQMLEMPMVQMLEKVKGRAKDFVLPLLQ